MTTQWMVYLTVVAAGLALAAYAAEQALVRWRMPSRWPWVVAVVGTPLVPVIRRWIGALGGASDGVSVGIGPIEMVGGIRLMTEGEAVQLDRLLLVAWILGSMAVAGYLVRSVLVVARLRRGWRRASVLGYEAWMSKAEGPAVLGFARNEVVVPSWFEGLSAEDQRLLLEHELEHVRARDSWLLLGGLAALVATPWNPLTWWQVSRLRSAIEVDCDRRVLDRQKSPLAYGKLLLSVAGRARPAPVGAAAFASLSSPLERRVRAITRTYGRNRVATGLAGSMVAMAALLGACQVEQPAAVRSEGTADGPAQTAAAAPVDIPETPFATPPRLSNRAEFAQALESGYPPLLKDAGIGGTVSLWVMIDTEGVVQNTRVIESSGRVELDETAVRVMRSARFSPALDANGEAVTVWIRIPVTFATAN